MKEQRIIIIDGPDCTGKTTLAAKLSKEHGLPFVHLGYKKDFDEFCKQFSDVMERVENGESFIVDRFILSNIIYAIIFQNGKTVPFVEKCINVLRNPVVHCVLALPADIDKWYDRFKRTQTERDELYTDEEKMKTVYHAYKVIGRVIGIPMEVYDLEKNLENKEKTLDKSKEQ